MTTERERALEEALRLLARSARTVFGALPIGQSLQPAGSAHTNDLIYATDEADKLLSASPLRPEGEALANIVRDAVIDTAARSPGNRGPYVFDEDKLQAGALSARPQPPQQPVAVKPLDWQKENVDGTFWTGWAQVNGFSGYQVKFDGKEWVASKKMLVIARYPECEPAKAACLANFENLIRSALYAAPLAQPVATAGEEREKLIARGEEARLRLAKAPGTTWSGDAIRSFIDDAIAALRPPVTQPNAEEAGK